jgi:hypothetical protein
MGTRETGADVEELVLQTLGVKSAPNHRLQATGNSVRSYLAPTIPRA